jgi:LysM repeat protein
MKSKFSTLGFVLLVSTLVLSGLGSGAVHAESLAEYIVQPGDTLLGIAARHGVSVSQLAWANELRWNSWVYVDQRLVIPGFTPAPTNNSSIHVVRRGDTLSAIAVRYGTTAYRLAQMNSLRNPNLIYVGQRLIVPQGSMGNPERTATVYRVQKGDTLIGIAMRFRVSMWDIVLVNNIGNPSLIFVGQRLVIPGRDSLFGSPAVTISPTSGPSGTLVQVVASGFPPSSPVSVGLGPVNSEFSEVAQGTTDANGRLTMQIPVQGAAGMKWVFGVNTGSSHATSVPFHITENNPTVMISPTSGPSGTLVRVVASGFAANTRISVGMGPQNSQYTEVAQGITNANGHFSADVPVLGASGMALVFAVVAEDQPGVTSAEVFHITD